MIRLLVAMVFACVGAVAQAETMRLAVTTSFHNSGLSDVLLPAIERDTGLEVQLLVVGTGQAIRLGEAGDVDAILVHSRAAEDAFVANGFGTHRREIMYNDFVLVGPREDPAGISASESAVVALERIASTRVPFVSRGDDSGTHKMELSLWAASDASIDEGWYREVGAGMGAALNTAAGLGAYILSDRASWLNFGNKDGMELLYSGDPVLFNQYAYLPVSAARHAHVKADAAATLEDWLTSATAQALIDDYRIAGEQLFVFNAQPRDE
ncbi:substrate-binding domain-containing protein [Jannaschia aquimarina]|uniref:PBP superfamily domain protein n=1 Tax=Jannaschia aquimarina TaxID=935700 RepID=A0A0D1EFR0_9RHOB|nr:substrate-binding domain-containing protein [Jannaschia aquimarina]KIT15721.1 PBP superfamily domain protein [Jannaschia aquimarina]SNT38685.1 tungstate transport system substrate-binding protein [Jannaschia aquimarina]